MDDIPWEELSDESLDTIAEIAISVSNGYSYSEVAEQLGLERKDVASRMGKLRREISDLTDPPSTAF